MAKAGRPAQEKTYSLEEVKKTIRSFHDYAPEVLRIQPEEGAIIPFAFNEAQKVFDDIINYIRNKLKLPIRIVLLKARREGMSTYITGRNFFHTSTTHNRYAVIVTHEPDATDFLFKMVKRYYNHAHPAFKPQTRYSNVKLLEFNDTEGTGLDSAIRVGTAARDDFGSGQMIHYAHFSEAAKWPRSKEKSLLTSLLQTVPDDIESEVIFESTARGMGGEFYNRFFGARHRFEVRLNPEGKPIIRHSINESAKPDNIYCSIFLPWFIFKKYEREPAEDFERTEEEQELALQYNLTDRKLAWRRWAVENRCGGDPDIFKQEYPSNPFEAFLASGRPVFNNPRLVYIKDNECKDPKVRYEFNPAIQQFLAEPRGSLKVWEEPRPGRQYCVGADVAEGLSKGDFSSADVVDQLSGVQVAHYHGHIDVDQFGELLYWLGRRYNDAWLGPERNNAGLTVVTKLLNMGYPRLYVETVPEPPNRTRKRYGWLTTRSTKTFIKDLMVAHIRDGTHGLRCADTVEEMMNLQYLDDSGLEMGVEGDDLFDDRVMSFMIAKELARRCPKSKNPLGGLMQRIFGGPAAKAQKPPNRRAFT
jgi:hypothetical protein